MNKTILSLLTILCLSFTLFPVGLAFGVKPVKAESNTWIVDDDGPADFYTIQEAINNANEGAIIFVRNGTYSENVFVNKTVMLIGESREATIINGNRTGNVLCVVENNVTVSNFTIIAGDLDLWKACGIYVNSSNNAFLNNIIAENNRGIYFDGAHNNNVSSNLMFGNLFGHYIVHSDNNAFERNSLTSNGIGFYSVWSDGSVLNNNIFVENDGVAILVMHGHLSTFKRNTLLSNEHGFWLDPVSDSLIVENSIVNNREVGIRFHGYSYDNVIIGNNITGNNDGLLFHDTTHTAILHNSISKNENGIAIHGGSSISVWLEIKYNNVVNNTNGLWQSEYGCARICQNNFISNNVQAKNEEQSIIQWSAEYPSGGNYWDDYTGQDLLSGPDQDESGGDGIGDTQYSIDARNDDRYPLMAPISTFDADTWNETSYKFDVVSNSTVSDFDFDPNIGPFMTFSVTGEKGTTGFCRVTIPKDILWVDNGWTISVGGDPITNYTTASDEDCTHLYFTYNHSTKIVQIEGTHVVPEFPSIIILPLFMTTTLLAVMIYTRKPKS